jgi:hypothetical protein
MRTHKLLTVACVGTLSLTLPASAQNEFTAQGMLATAKFAGACGILDSMINFQKTTRMPGGDDFVARFWSVEAARLGLSVQALSDRCDQSIIAYDKLWKAGEPARK